jgi:predicted transcriptional regulator
MARTFRKNGLTERDRKVLAALDAWEVTNKRTCPTLRELATIAELPQGTTQDCIRALSTKGLLYYVVGKPRTMQITEPGREFLEAKL